MKEPFDLSPTECRDLLGAGLVGRVAVCTPLGPHIVPVNYGVVDDSVVLRTSPYSVLGGHANGSIVALEVDQFDYEHRHGWSVVVRGRATAVTNAEELTRVRTALGPETWAAGQRNLYPRVPWSEISGRRLGRGWKPADGLHVRPAI
jgi:hypothetical protein